MAGSGGSPAPIPTAPKAFPLLGHLIPLLRDPLGFLLTLPGHGDLVRIRIGPASVVMVCDPDLTREVLRDDRTFGKGGPFFEGAAEIMGYGLLLASHGDHRRQRRLVQPAFHPSRLPAYARTMTDSIARTVGSWRPGQVVDVLDELSTITLRSLALTMFSDALSPQVLRQALDDTTTIVEGFYRRMLMPRWVRSLPIPGNRGYHRASIRLRMMSEEVVRARRGPGPDRGDLLSALLAARDPDSAAVGLSDTEIVDDALLFFFAGMETTASAVAWALHLVAEHPDVERRLHTEVDAVLAGRPATYEDLPRLGLTTRIVTESLRIRPPVWLLTREATRDTCLGGSEIPAGTVFAYSPYLLHHRQERFPDPHRFDPDRWLPARSETTQRNACVPFGGGARKCIGEAFAMIETVLILATVTARWRLESLPGQRVRPVVRGTLRPRRLPMHVISRDDTISGSCVRL